MKVSSRNGNMLLKPKSSSLVKVSSPFVAPFPLLLNAFIFARLLSLLCLQAVVTVNKNRKLKLIIAGLVGGVVLIIIIIIIVLLAVFIPQSRS